MKKIMCKRGHRMIEIVPGLHLCECSDYGRLSYRKGATEEARRLIARAGGLEKLRDAIEAEEERKRKTRSKRTTRLVA